MKANDFGILIKKIAVGIIIYLIPVILLVGGLLLTKVLLKKDIPANTKSHYVQP